MHCPVTQLRVHHALFRSRTPLRPQFSSPNLTRRAAHSGLLDSTHLRRLPTRTYHLILQFQAPFLKERTIVGPCPNATSIPPSSFPAGSCPEGLLPSNLTQLVTPTYVFSFRKASKSLTFFPLKDSYGTTQLVVHTDVDKITALSAVPPESVVLIQGRVRSRPIHSKRNVGFPIHNLPRLSVS